MWVVNSYGEFMERRCWSDLKPSFTFCPGVFQCDGQYIPLPSLQGIAVLNIPSYAGGTNFWGGTKEDDVSTFTVKTTLFFLLCQLMNAGVDGRWFDTTLTSCRPDRYVGLFVKCSKNNGCPRIKVSAFANIPEGAPGEDTLTHSVLLCKCGADV